MKVLPLAFAAAMGSAFAAQAQIETVVVTGSRISYDADTVPFISVTERADHLITKVKVVCDTRDTAARKNELRQTLRNMIAESGRGSISLSVGDDILVDFTPKMLDDVILPDSKVDTSYAYVVIRTELTKDDTFDDAAKRIRDYVARTPKAGRSEILIEERFNLGLIQPEKYRDPLIGKIAQDAKRTAALFGDDYRNSIEGLQHPIQWYQVGPLDLGLYIPYRLTIAPARP